MALTGDTKALEAFGKRIRKLEGVPRVVAEKASPKISALVTASFGAQSSPYGAGWVPTKSGAPAFGGGNALGRVLVRLVGKATIRTSVLYPLHFHNAGTHTHGRKYQARMRKALRAEGYGRAGIKGIVKEYDVARRHAGNVHDPARPMIPDEAEGIPKPWETEIRQAAHEAMGRDLVTERR